MYALHRTSFGLALLAGLLVAGPAFAQSLQSRSLQADNPSLIKQRGTPTDIVPKPHKMELPSFGPAVVLFDAGSVVNSTGTGVGGADEGIEYDVSTSSGSVGYGHQASAGNRVADDFTVPAGGWTIDQIVFYGYQSGAPSTGTIDNVNFRVWNGEPGAPGSSVVYGDDTTNRFVSTSWTGAYRVTEGTFCPTGVCNSRAIMANTVDASGLSLSEGTYWLDWQSGGSASFSGPWAPPVAQTSVACPTGNALQFTGSWNVLQNGTCTTGESLPFQIIGTTGGSGGGGGTTVAESGDAPSGWDGTQDATGDVDAITGAIATGDIADCYAIEIADIDAFSVNTFNSPSLSDPQLYLFSSSLEGILHNDDAAGVTSFQAEMPAGSLSGLGLSPGEFVFCVVDFDQDPFNAADESIFGPNIARGVLQGPVTSDTVLDDWNNTTAITPGEYQLDFTGLGDIGGGGGGNVPAMFSGDNTGGPTWQRPFTAGDGTSGSCSLSGTGNGVNYEVTTFSTDTNGTYSIEMTYLSPGHDGYIHLYEGAFDPADQCLNLIALDDDHPTTGTGGSLIEAIDLTSGTDYHIVISGFSATGDDFGPYDGVIDGPAGASITFGGGGGGACEDLDLAISPVTDYMVGSGGGMVRMVMEITNNSDEDCEFEAWGMSMDPLLTNGVFIRPGRHVMVPANSILRQGYNQRVPSSIADGDYDYTVSIGQYDELDPANSEVYDAEDAIITKGNPTLGFNEFSYEYIKWMHGHDEAEFKAAFIAALPFTPTLSAKDWSGVELGAASIRPVGAPITVEMPMESHTVAVGTTVGPNPFRGQTTFEFDVQEEAPVSLQVFDVLGRLVATPVEGQLPSGRHSAVFSGRDLQAGTYVYRLQIGETVETGRVTLAR